MEIADSNRNPWEAEFGAPPEFRDKEYSLYTEGFMKRVAFLLFAAALLAGLVVSRTPASGQSEANSSPAEGIKLPDGYRHWEMISIAQVGPPFNDLRVKLRNDAAMKAFRDSTRPFPDGTIIARLAYQQVASEENNKVFRAAAERKGLPPDQIEKLLPDPPSLARRRTFSSWSSTQKNTLRLADGDSLNSQTANQTARQSPKPASAAIGNTLQRADAHCSPEGAGARARRIAVGHNRKRATRTYCSHVA